MTVHPLFPASPDRQPQVSAREGLRLARAILADDGASLSSLDMACLHLTRWGDGSDLTLATEMRRVIARDALRQIGRDRNDIEVYPTLAEEIAAGRASSRRLLIALAIGILLTLGFTSFVADRVFPAIAAQQVEAAK